MKLNLLRILYAILLCWRGLGLDNIFFESDALSKLCSVYGFVVIWIALFTVNFSHLHYNIFKRGCEAISGKKCKIARNCLTSTFKDIVMVMSNGNHEKGYSTVALCKFPCIWWEFEEFAHWLGGGGGIVDVWSLHALVVWRVYINVMPGEG